MKEHKIFLIGGDDDEYGVLAAERQGEKCCLSFAVRGQTIEASADDYFEAFCHIRHQLEVNSIIPFCYAASLNVYPSRMSRQMAGGTVAYLLTPAKQADTRVHIFEAGPNIIPASVEQQHDYYVDWLASLGA